MDHSVAASALLTREQAWAVLRKAGLVLLAAVAILIVGTGAVAFYFGGDFKKGTGSYLAMVCLFGVGIGLLRPFRVPAKRAIARLAFNRSPEQVTLLERIVFDVAVALVIILVAAALLGAAILWDSMSA